MTADAYTIITAAAESTELFLQCGFTTPRNLVQVENETVLVKSIRSNAYDLDKVNVALNAAEIADWGTDRLIKESFPGLTTYAVSSRARGALISALVASAGIPRDSPLVVAAGDSEVDGGVNEGIDALFRRGVSAGTLVYEDTNPRRSYVELGRGCTVNYVAEKEVVSNFATAGVFYFKTTALFLDAAEWCLVNNLLMNDRYFVSSALNYLISAGERVECEFLERESYKSWSLPVDFASKIGE